MITTRSIFNLLVIFLLVYAFFYPTEFTAWLQTLARGVQ